MNKLLLHICCAPCLIYPLKRYREIGTDLKGFFYNPNIHPLDEYRKREKTLTEYANAENLNIIYQSYDIEDYFSLYDREKDRCAICYRLRLEKTAITAKNLGYNAFSTTLLYSVRQKHELIKQIGEALGLLYNIKFFYEDFRKGWKEGIEESKRLGLYRQRYCGCIFSEKERFYRS